MPAGVHLRVVYATFDVKNNLGGRELVAVAPPAARAGAEICHASGGRRQRAGTNLPEDFESGIGVWSRPGVRWLHVHDGMREVLVWYPDGCAAKEAHRAGKAAELREVNVLDRRCGGGNRGGGGGRRGGGEGVSPAGGPRLAGGGGGSPPRGGAGRSPPRTHTPTS